MRMTEAIMKEAGRLPEGAPIAAKSLLRLGSRAAVDQALSRLTRRGQLLRAERGLYVRPVESRFGSRAPEVEKVVEGMAGRSGETVVPSGAAAANRLGLTTQVPSRSVYLTSGRNRTLHLGKQTVELKHAPAWQLVMAGRPAGEAVRALAWMGKPEVEGALKTLRRKLPPGEVKALRAAAPLLPAWLAEPVSALPARG